MDLKCKKCNAEASYSEKYDAYYCKSCNEWTEDICTDRDCEYCKNRPNRPKDVNLVSE